MQFNYGCISKTDQGIGSKTRLTLWSPQCQWSTAETERTELSETKFDIFAITETHLCENITDNEIFIGYLFKRKDRTGQKNKWGGVLICYRDYLEIHEIKVKPEYTKMEGYLA